MATEETTAVMDELESPQVDKLANLRTGTAEGMENFGRIAEQADRLLRKIEAAKITESNAELLNWLNRLHMKVQRAKEDVDEARSLTSRAGQALREAQAAGRNLYHEDGRPIPDHLETVPGRTVGPASP